MDMPPQANSLSSITQLAGNPPRYPRNPTEQKRESLVLYIARVPGSRDVILTTMKPRLKNVTAEDVLNSLYYFHVDTPSDVFLMGDMQGRETSEPALENSTALIVRKPLSGDLATERSREGPQLSERNRETETTLSRVPSDALRFNTVQKPIFPRRPLPDALDQKPPLRQRPSSDANNLPTRRPLGPRPYISNTDMDRKLLSGSENTPMASSVRQGAPVSTPSINNCHAQASDTLHAVKISGESSFPSNNDQLAMKEAFSITVIRREPASGAQWNVGQIINRSMLQDEALSSVTDLSLHRSCSLVAVQLTTLGYGQFRVPLTISNTSNSITNRTESQEPQYTRHSFDREVRMVWSKSWERKYKQHRRASSDQAAAWKGARIRNGIDISSGKFKIEATEAAGTDRVKNAVLGSGFLSPWNGRCEFSTSASGRSLKCKHTLNNSTATSTLAAPFSGGPVDVSELRFNLPSSSTTDDSLSTASARRPASSYTEMSYKNYKNDFPKPPATSYAALYPSDDENEDDDPDDVLDLSLGREKAGGGIRGKRVKLGKLIVHDEGLKMLDLVVAANMGIWWTVWER